VWTPVDGLPTGVRWSTATPGRHERAGRPARMRRSLAPTMNLSKRKDHRRGYNVSVGNGRSCKPTAGPVRLALAPSPRDWPEPAWRRWSTA
jgi:hypothetical protein